MEHVSSTKVAPASIRSPQATATAKARSKPAAKPVVKPAVTKPKDSFERSPSRGSSCSAYSTTLRPPKESFECRLEGVAKKLGGKAGSAAAVALVRAAAPAVSKLADAAIKRLDEYIDKNGCGI